MADVLTVFLFIALTAFAGFLGGVFFKKTRFSDFVLLMVIGLLVGPVFNLLGTDSVTFLRGVTPFFASLALVMIIFEGALQLNFYRVLQELPKSTLFTVLIFLITTALVTTVLVFFGWDLLFAILVGCLLGETSSAIVVPLARSIMVSEETQTLLTLETAFNDAITIIATIAVAQIIIAQNVSIQIVSQNILAAFSIAALLGLVFGVLWLKVMRDFPSTREYDYVLTLATVFFLYSATEFLGGNGITSALVFGIVLGNAKDIGGILRMPDVELDSNITLFQKEISLFVTTFFFLYLGIIFDMASMTIGILAVALAITIAIYLARYIGVEVLARVSKKFEVDKRAIRSMMARGLAAAVLATYPLSVGIDNPHVGELMQIVFLVILFTNILNTIWIFDFEIERRKYGFVRQASGKP